MQTFNYLNFIEGLYSDVTPILVPENALYLQDNCVTSYKLGSILKRPGYVKIGSTLQATKSITSLHHFRQSASTQKMLATVNNAGGTALQLLYSTGDAWTPIGAAVTAWNGYEDAKVEFEDFIGYCFMVGYDSTDSVFLPPRTLTGTTFGTTNTTSMPNAKYIKRYRDRLYIANCDISGTKYPYRVYYSTVPSAGSITWTVASNFIDVDFSEDIKGIETNWDRLVVFTEYSAYMYNQSEKKQVWDVGCSNHRTIKNSGVYMIWANRDGIWMSTGDRPINVAGRAIDFIRGTNMTNSFAELVDEEYYLYIGSATVNGVSYSNCAVVLNLPTKTVRIEEYADTIISFGKFYSSGQDNLYMGASDGDVHRRGKYTNTNLLTTDNGAPIHSWFQTGFFSFGDPSSSKGISKIFAYADRAQGLELKARVGDKNTLSLSEFKPLGQLTKYINEFQCNPNKGNFIQFEGIENGSNQYWSLMGLSVLVDIDKLTKA